MRRWIILAFISVAIILFPVFEEYNVYAAHDILWDTYHGINAGYSPAGKFSDMTAYLEGLGYNMDETAAGIMSLDLDSYCVVVLNLGSAWFSAYTTAEADKIEDYVLNGGSLFVLGDNISGPPNPNLTPVTERFGIVCGISNTRPFDLLCTVFIVHPLFTGMKSFYQEDGGVISVASPAMEICWEDPPYSRPVGAIATPGYGKVLVLGDINTFDNTRLPMVDNLQFCHNIFEWLCPLGIQPTPIPTATPYSIPAGNSSSGLLLCISLTVIFLCIIHGIMRYN